MTPGMIEKPEEKAARLQKLADAQAAKEALRANNPKVRQFCSRLAQFRAGPNCPLHRSALF